MRSPDDYLLAKTQRFADAVNDRFGLSCYKLAEQVAYFFVLSALWLSALLYRDGDDGIITSVFLVVIALITGSGLVWTAIRYERASQDRAVRPPPSTRLVRLFAVGWALGWILQDIVLMPLGLVDHPFADVALDVNVTAMAAWHYLMACHRRPRRRQTAKVPRLSGLAKATGS